MLPGLAAAKMLGGSGSESDPGRTPWAAELHVALGNVDDVLTPSSARLSPRPRVWTRLASFDGTLVYRRNARA